MLKTFSHITLSLILLVSTMGMAVSKHYCGDDLVSVSLYDNSEDDSCCDMDNCCHNENQVFQVKEDFSVPAISSIPVLAEFDILGHNLTDWEAITEPEAENNTLSFIDSPPPKTIQKVLSLKQVYLL